MTIWEKHQLAIAKKTLKMSDAAILILGGMTREEAQKIVDKHKKSKKGKNRQWYRYIVRKLAIGEYSLEVMI